MKTKFLTVPEGWRSVRKRKMKMTFYISPAGKRYVRAYDHERPDVVISTLGLPEQCDVRLVRWRKGKQVKRKRSRS